MDNVFAYGILMRDGSRAAKLHGYRLDFDGFATVVEETGAVVHGALIENVSAGQLRSYDGIEGYLPGRDEDLNLYNRRLVAVETDDGPERAWVYVKQGFVRRGPGWSNSGWGIVQSMRMEYLRLGHGQEAFDTLDAAARAAGEASLTAALWRQDARP